MSQDGKIKAVIRGGQLDGWTMLLSKHNADQAILYIEQPADGPPIPCRQDGTEWDGTLIYIPAGVLTMEDAGDTSAATAALHAAMSTPATTSQDVHATPSAEGSQAQETIPYGVADPPGWPEPADPANPGGGIKP